MKAAKAGLGLYFYVSAAALVYGANPIVIDNTTYVPVGTSESFIAPFTESAGIPTTNTYSGYVLVTVSGTGYSWGPEPDGEINDAFYFTRPGVVPGYTPPCITPCLSTDGNYRLRYSNAPMGLFATQYDANLFLVYDGIAETQVTPPYAPAFQSSSTYSFVLPVPSGGPSQLYFGVADGNFTDNSGQYNISVTQLQAEPREAAPMPGISTNMVSGTQWPGGDPFLQRQNEPSMAVSSRNPLHVAAGDNDYRTVDIPFNDPNPNAEPTGDAWLGFFTSYDGGQTWTSTLVPGYPQDTSSQGTSSPIYGMNAGADPGVRPGPNGMFLYSGLAFKRDQSASKIFLARYVDDNNLESGNSIRYLDTRVIAAGAPGTFLDKPAVAVDIPRGTNTCNITGPDGSASTIPAFSVYVAYSLFNGVGESADAQVKLSQSQDCGVTWSAPINVSNPGGVGAFTNQGAQLAIDPSNGTVYVVWRIFASSGQVDAIAGHAYQLNANGAINETTYTPAGNFPITPFDQDDADGTAFRTNGYPAIAVDDSSHLYIAWSQRGLISAPGGDARVVMAVALNGNFTSNQPQLTVDPYTGRGHQIMPALAYSAGKLTAAWYDFRDDGQGFVYSPLGGGQFSSLLQPLGTPTFGSQVDDAGTPLRHTVDIRAAQSASAAQAGDYLNFSSSVLVSQYSYGTPSGGGSTIEQLEYSAPNLPLFKGGTTPFIGDYIDVAGPTMLYDSAAGKWRFNNLSTDVDYTHVIWTDNRNVIPPADGNWAHYTAVALNQGTMSIFDPTQTIPASCQPGQTGMRNQDIYTATLSPGIIMGAPGNAKPLSTSLQREFAVTVQNTTMQPASYRLTFGTLPAGVTASFAQFGALPFLDITIPALSTAARSVYITASNATASVPVFAQQISAPGGSLLPNGLASSVILNPDISNPNISNPNISNPNISNPNISNAEVYNPNISNPNISNPNISNPNISNPNISNPNISNITIANPNISNPNISNPNISNPNISNPNISNPNISNPNISNAALTDVNYIVTNNGNTTTTYTVQLLGSQATVPMGVTVQLIVSGIYTTPVANACTLAVEAHYVPLLNETSPQLLNAPNTSGTPGANDFTFVLPPGGQIMVTLRAYDSTTNNDATALAHYNPAMAITPVIVSAGANTGSLTPSASLITITTSSIAAPVALSPYSQSFQATGGAGTGYQWSTTSPLPEGLSLTSAGVLQGTPIEPGTFPITINVTDGSNNMNSKMFTLHVNATGAVPASGTACNGAFTGAFKGNITVSGGQVCEIVGGSVSGNLTSTGGIVRLVNATVAGNLTISGTATGAGAGLPHQVCGSKISGNLTFQSDHNAMVIGGAQGSACGPTSISGNLTVSGNSAAISATYTTINGNLTATGNGSSVTVTSDTVKGNLTVQTNTGPVIIQSNSVSGNLTATGNKASVAIADNTVKGNLTVQTNTGSSTGVTSNTVSGNLACSGNTAITGSGNKAAKKQGQCAAF